MNWQVKFDERVDKDLLKIGPQAAKRVIQYLESRIAGEENPERFGKALKAELKGLWRYRVDDYRIICHITKTEMTVLVVAVGNRKNIYKR